MSKAYGYSSCFSQQDVSAKEFRGVISDGRRSPRKTRNVFPLCSHSLFQCIEDWNHYHWNPFKLSFIMTSSQQQKARTFSNSLRREDSSENGSTRSSVSFGSVCVHHYTYEEQRSSITFECLEIYEETFRPLSTPQSNDSASHNTCKVKCIEQNASESHEFEHWFWGIEILPSLFGTRSKRASYCTAHQTESLQYVSISRDRR